MKHFFALIYFFSFTVCVFSIPVENLVSANRLAQLKSAQKGRIIETHIKDTTPTLIPNNSNIRQNVTEVMNTLKPNILVEALYLYIKPAQAKTDSALWDEKQKNIVFTQMTAISTLTGIQYYSSSRKAMRVFYEYSSIIDGPTTKKSVPDPVFNQTPGTLTFFTRQKDLTFGDNIYRYYNTSTQDVLFSSVENITTLNFGIIPVISKGNLHLVMSAIDCGDSILIYAVSIAKVAAVSGLSDKISNSFSNRAQALLDWFSDRLNREF